MDEMRPFGDRVAQAVNWWGKFPVGDFVVDTDGMKKGDSKCDKDFDGARPSAETMHDMMVYLWTRVKNVGVHVFHCPQTLDVPCLVKTIDAINAAYKETIGNGKDLENRGRVHYEPPIPPEPPKPPKPPDPPLPPIPPEPPAPPMPEPKTCYQKYIAHRPMRLWQVSKFFKCLFGG
jgi:hypothetical protein